MDGRPPIAASAPAAGFRLGHRPVLDGLRGLAVLAVMAYHSGLRRFLPGGFLGVDLFFVLSGFLITVLLVQEQQQTGAVHLGRFYLRRALRLLPALFVMLGVCCLWAALRTKTDREWEIYRAALLTACYGANWNWCGSIRMSLLTHAWSLSLEEQFYLAWPLILLAFLRSGAGLRRIAGFAVLGIVASAGCRAVLYVCGCVEAATVCPAARADSLLAGCVVGLVACANRLPQSRGPRVALQIAAGLAAVLLALLGVMETSEAPSLYLGGYGVAAIAAAVVIAAVVNDPLRSVSRALSWPVLTRIGRISYGLYLWHFPMLTIAPKLLHGVFPVLHGHPALDDGLSVGLAFLAALLSYWAVERPMLRWKAKVAAPLPNQRPHFALIRYRLDSVRMSKSPSRTA